MNRSIGHYELLNLIGAGGRGEVYRARDTRVGRTVAVRVLGEQAPDALRRDRFVHELEPVTRLSHPHLATLFEAGQVEGQVYLVYEFVPGDKLSALTAGHPMNLRRAFDLTGQIADGLADAHASEIVHQELTPANIIVTPKGHAKVLDIGLAGWRQAPDANRTAARLAQRGTALGAGSIAYMAPEQILGQPIDHRADVFTLGAIFYEMVTGRPAFSGKNDGETAVQVLQGTPPAPSSINREVTPQVDAIVARALAKSIGDRYQSAAEFAAALRAASSSSQSGRGSVAIPPTAIRRRRSWLRALAVATVLVLAVAAAAWTWRDDLLRQWNDRFGPPLPPVIVVMPFQLQAEDTSRGYFAVGLSDDVAMRMGQVPGARVLGRSSIRSFRGRDAATVARELRAGLALTGTVTPGDEGWTSLGVRVDLVDAANGARIWTQRYTIAPRDILQLQIRIVTDVAARMRLPFTPGSQQGRTALRLVEPDAYDLYLQARDAAATGDASRAADLYTSALDRDPSLLEARAGLVVALYTSAVFDERMAYADVEGRMRDAAEQVATTDPDFGAARMAMGLTAPTIHECLIQLRRATESDPSSSTILRVIGTQIRDVDPVLALRFFRRSLELDAAQAATHLDIAGVDVLLDRLDPARDEVTRGQALAPSSPWWDGMRARILLAEPSRARAGTATPVPPEATEFAAGWYARAAVLRVSGRQEDAVASLTSLVRLYPGFCEARALLAGMRMEAGDRAEGARLATQIFRTAGAPRASLSWYRCAAMAAAAVSDPDRTAAWITRVAGSDAALRMWTTTNGIVSAQAGIHQKLFPWSNVIDQPQVVQALVALDRSIARTRADAAKVLDGLLGPEDGR